MNNVLSSRVLALLAALLLTSAFACAESPTQPTVPGARAPRDTTPIIQGDTTACRSGWIIEAGRYICL